MGGAKEANTPPLPHTHTHTQDNVVCGEAKRFSLLLFSCRVVRWWSGGCMWRGVQCVLHSVCVLCVSVSYVLSAAGMGASPPLVPVLSCCCLTLPDGDAAEDAEQH